ncbi:MAG: ATP-dependent DNA helicase [Candidatus Levybacteria bacterium]|nr:ATP-dependent DNA helicase [Candidatus Levybacteria bacterium]
MGEDKVLNEEQKKAVKHKQGPLLIVAGAGTGKTTVITERIKYLVLQKKVVPSQILALTFTEKSAREMEERVDKAMPYGYTQMWISTFHSFCDRILRNEALHIGLNPSYKLLSESEIILLLRKNLFKFELDYFRPLGNPYKFLEGLVQHLSRLKDEDISPNEYLHWAQTQNSKVKIQKSGKLNARRYTLDAENNEIKKTLELANAYKTYEDLKMKEGVMDFSDLISNTLKLFRERKNILKTYRKQFKYILVDEFQDTNFAQNELAILLAGEQKNITVVGDDDQAIYRWRGAAISNMIQFKKYFPKAKIITLTKNYRSTKEILNKSYKLIQNNNPDRLEVKEKISKKLESVRKIQGDPLDFIYAGRVENEAEIVVERIKLLKKDGLEYKDIAILVRANDHSLPFTKALFRQNIPYQFLGPGQLFRQEEIKDLIAYLKVLYNFEDSSSLYRVLNMPVFNFEYRDIAVILNFARRKNLSLFEALESSAGDFKKITEMVNRHLKRVPKDTAGQILYYFLEESGLLKKMISPKNEVDEKKAQNIAKFFDKLKTYEVEHEDASVFAIVDWIDLSMLLGESPLASNSDWNQANAVNILTIHSSKGLEFPVVFLVNLVEGRFPTRERKEQIPIPQELIKEILPVGDYHIEEERRLFYVGMTRARDFLFLTASNFYGEGKRERKISPFVYETLGEDFVKKLTSQQFNNETMKQLSFLDEWKTPEVSTLNPIQSGQLSTPVPIIYLSYSQIQTFNICPLHYKLKYILKIPTPPTSALSFGTSIHSTLRDYFQKIINNEKVEENEVYEMLKKVWINEGYKSKIHEKNSFEKAKKIISEYLKNNLSVSNPVGLEIPFQFFLKREKGMLKVGGRIDRIDKINDNQIEIIDYKTGRNVPDEKKLTNDLQLTFYALAATEVNDRLLNKKPQDVLLSLYYLETGKKLTTTRTEEQLNQAKELILKKAEEISKSEFLCSHSSICRDCEYKILCST